MDIATSTFVTYGTLISWQSTILNQLSSNVIEYIAVAITILLALSGGTYFFSFRPFEKDMEGLKGEIRRVKDEADSNISNKISDAQRIIEENASGLMTSLKSELEVYKKDTLDRASESAKLLTSELENKILGVIKDLNDKLVESDKIIVSTQRDVEELKRAVKGNEREIKGLKIKTREAEAFIYSQQGKMGAILVPLELIETCLNDPFNEWRIGEYLTSILNEVKGAKLNVEQQSKIIEIIDKVPKKYSNTVDAIKEILKKML